MTLPSVLDIIGEWSGARSHVVCGDALEMLRPIPSESVDFVLTDVPYGLGNREPTPEDLIAYLQGERLNTGGDFMGEKWEIPSVAVWREVYRIAKPGAFVLSFGGTRTFDLIAMGMRMAGFERRGTLMWLQAQGNPKGINNIGKAIDKKDGKVREVVGRVRKLDSYGPNNVYGGGPDHNNMMDITSPATPESAEWEGHGTGLAPCYEPIVICRKPLIGTVVDNIRAYGLGAYNIDGCRIATDWNEPDRPESWKRSGHSQKPEAGKLAAPPGVGISCHPKGRWPGDVLFSHGDCECVGTRVVESNNGTCGSAESAGQLQSKRCDWGMRNTGLPVGYASPDGTETIPSYACSPGCPVAELDRQAGERKSGSRAAGVRKGMGYHGANGDGGPAIESSEGTASRFFVTFPPEQEAPFRYAPKVSPIEREIGCEHLPVVRREEVDGRKEGSAGQKNHLSGMTRTQDIHNHGKCVKPIAITRWLARLCGKPGGVALVPYCGTGSEMIGCLLEGMRVVGIERDPTMIPIANARISWWQSHPGGPTPAAREEAKLEARGQLSLLGAR